MEIRHDPSSEVLLQLHGMHCAVADIESHLYDFWDLHISQKFVVAPHSFVRNRHYLAVHLRGLFVDSDRIIQRLRHLFHAWTPAFENRRGQHHLRLLTVSALQFAAYQQIEFLVGAAEFHVGFECYRVVSLHQRIEQFVQSDGFFFAKALVKVLALQQLRDRILRHQADEIIGSKLCEPAPIEVDHSLLRIENLEHLRFVCLGVLLNLLARERRPRGRASRGVADHPGEVADQKDCGVAEILKVLELAQNHSVPQMQIGSSWIHAKLHAQRLAGATRLLQLGAQVGFADNFRRTFLEIGKLFVDREEG